LFAVGKGESEAKKKGDILRTLGKSVAVQGITGVIKNGLSPIWGGSRIMQRGRLLKTGREEKAKQWRSVSEGIMVGRLKEDGQISCHNSHGGAWGKSGRMIRRAKDKKSRAENNRSLMKAYMFSGGEGMLHRKGTRKRNESHGRDGRDRSATGQKRLPERELFVEGGKKCTSQKREYSKKKRRRKRNRG